MFNIQEKYHWKDLLKIMAALRAPNGCSWDQKQDHHTLLKYLKEECAEFIDAVNQKDFPNMKEELGDVLLQVVFHAQIAKEDSHFTIEEVIHTLVFKLVERHPHVFGDVSGLSPEEVEEQWEVLKGKEKDKQNRKSLMDGIPTALEELPRAHKVQDRAKKVGFDWPNLEGVFEKLHEEVDELKEAVSFKDRQEMELELGDVLFSVVNLARHLDIRADEALNKSTEKFEDRFRKMELLQNLEEASLEELEDLWQKVKLKE